MPITQIRNATDNPLLEGADGKLTLEGAAVLDFLHHVDFSVLDTVEGLDEALVDVEVTNEDKTTESYEALPLDVALRLVDHDELAEMFIDYVLNLDESTLEAKARKAMLLNSLGLTENDAEDDTDEDDDLDEAKLTGKARAVAAKRAAKTAKLKPMARGRLKAMRNSKNAKVKDTAIRMLIAMREKGAIIPGKTGAPSHKGPQYPEGTTAGNRKVAQFLRQKRQATKAMVKGYMAGASQKAVAAAKVKGPSATAKAARKARGGKATTVTRKAARFVLPAEESVFLLGFGEPVGDRLYSASLDPNLSEDDMDELTAYVESIDFGESARENKVQEDLNRVLPGILEGADLAGRALNRGKPLNG